jgi:hypothetical protein
MAKQRLAPASEGKRKTSARAAAVAGKSLNGRTGARKSATPAKAKAAANGRYATRKPRISSLGEREANIERATSRVKTTATVDLVRQRRG